MDFQHDTHTHPFVPATTGSKTGSFVIPTSGETSANVWYRIYLTVRDGPGLTHTTYRDVLPRTATITLASVRSGLQLTLDGQPVTAPYAVLGVVGITRAIGVMSPQTLTSTPWTFASWSDGGAGTHNITTRADQHDLHRDVHAADRRASERVRIALARRGRCRGQRATPLGRRTLHRADPRRRDVGPAFTESVRPSIGHA